MAEENESPIEGLSGEQRAAILVVLLGEEVCAGMFPHLSKREVAKIARQVAELGPVDPEVAQAVLEDYYLCALNGPQTQGGPDIARKILTHASISEEIMDQLVREPTQNEVLGPLLETPPDTLARALQDEHPQTAALVLLHLPPERAGQLLAALPETSRSETVLRMASVRLVREEIIDQVATSLRERLSTTRRAQDAQGGIERTANVLGSMSRSDAKQLLDELEEEHPEEVQSLRERLYTFDSLMAADDRGMQELLRSIDSSRLALALVGCDEALQERFLGNLSARASSMLSEEMEFLGTPNPKDQAEAQKEILDAALKLESEGSLTFQEAGEGGGD